VIVSVVELTPRPSPNSLVLATDIGLLAVVNWTLDFLTGDVTKFSSCRDVMTLLVARVKREVVIDVDVHLTSLDVELTASPVYHQHKLNLKAAQNYYVGFHELILKLCIAYFP